MWFKLARALVCLGHCPLICYTRACKYWTGGLLAFGHQQALGHRTETSALLIVISVTLSSLLFQFRVLEIPLGKNINQRRMKGGSESGWLAAYLPAAWAGHVCQVATLFQNIQIILALILEISTEA